MKKALILMGICLVAITSCSKDQVTKTNPGNAIGFRTAVDTRATETTQATLQSFYVTAFENYANVPEKFFENVEFERIVDHFVSMPEYYWPSDGSSLYFSAYAPGPAELGCSATYSAENGMELKDFSPKGTISEQTDFITAGSYGSSADASKGVVLTFNHQLSQITIMAYNTNNEYVYSVKGVRIGNVASKGTFNFKERDWTTTSDKATYEVRYSTAKSVYPSPSNFMEAIDIYTTDNAMLIPQQLTAWDPEDAASTGSYIGLLINIKTKDGAQVYPAEAEAYDWVAVPVSTKWEPGIYYTYTLDLSNGAGYIAPDPDDITNTTGTKIGNTIKATMTVKGWEDVDVTEIVYAELLGIWEAYQFEHIDYEDEECTIEKERLTVNNIEGGEYYDVDNLKAVCWNFYKFKITEAGELIALDDNLSETDVRMFFTYENGDMKIPSLDGTRTVPHVDCITTDDETGVITARLSIDRRPYPDDRQLQYLYYTLTR